MKKISAIVVMLLGCAALEAQQPWFLPNSNGPVRLQDAAEAYKQYSANNGSGEEEEIYDGQGLKVEQEGRNYQFDRWMWYWKNHTDENGYMVSPVRTWNEWQSYLHNNANTNVNARTTGISSYWTFQGPTVPLGGNYGVGRINVVAFHPSDSNTFWIGSAGGGAWKTTDNGNTWTPMYNNLPLLGVSDIDINPLNPNTIYICTGDGDGQDNYSAGVFKSTDGGNTWDTTGLHWNTSSLYLANSLVINPIDTNSLLLASSAGIFKSLNGGKNWTLVSGGNFKQILYNPADTNIVLASTFNVGDIYRSADGGTTWQAVTSNSSISGGVIRIAMAVTPANPAIVKAVFSNNAYGLQGIYSSSDSGKTFTEIFGDSSCSRNILNTSSSLNSNTCGGQGWYDLCITISPLDSNLVLVGGVNTWQSTNGGYQWSIITQWASSLPGVKIIHADKHFMCFNPLTPNVLYQSNDGGVFRSLNPNSLWTDLSQGLGITQFYRIAVSNLAPYVIGGAQDNGTKMMRSGTEIQLTGADGMNCQVDFTDSNTFYTASQYGSINRTQDHGAHYTSISNNIASPAPTGSWVTPYLVHPMMHNILLAGYNMLYLSTDFGQSWNSISPIFSGGQTIDRITAAYTNINNIYILIGNVLRYTSDLGNTWQMVYNSAGGIISDIAVDPKNENIVWASFSGYNANKVGYYSLTTKKWTFVNGTLPNVPVECIAIDSSSETIYLGTDVAVFYKDTTMTDWALFNNNLPNVMIDDIGINYTTNEIWVATFGRGFWKSAKYDQTPSAVSIIPYAMNVVNASPNPNNGHFAVSTNNKDLMGRNVEVRLISSVGKTLWQGLNSFSSNGTMNINAEGLAKGIYILEISGNNVITRNRIVIY